MLLLSLLNWFDSRLLVVCGLVQVLLDVGEVL